MTIHRHGSREAWLTWRGEAHRIGGTDACAILRQSPWAGPWDVWARHRGEATSAGPDAAVAERGHELEPVGLARYARRTGADIALDLITVTHPEEPWAFASPDALIIVDGVVVGISEVKTVSRSDLGYLWVEDEPEPSWVRQLDGLVVPAWHSREAERLPSSWLTQIQWYLECIGVEWCDLVIVGPHVDDVQVLRVMRDREFGAAMLRSVRAWRARHLLGVEVPPLDGSDVCSRWARGVWLETERPRRVVVDGEIAADVVTLGAAKEAARRADEVVAEVRPRLLAAAADLGASRLRAGGYEVVINKRGAVSVREVSDE